MVKTSTEGGKLYAADGCLLALFIENKSSDDGTAPEPSPSFTFGCLMECFVRVCESQASQPSDAA